MKTTNRSAGEREVKAYRKLKVAVVGDSGCGKTSIILSHLVGCLFEIYSETKDEKYDCDLDVDGETFRITINDTKGIPSKVRAFDKGDVDAVILCYAVDDYNSFLNLEKQWLTKFEINRHPLILVACKTDLYKNLSDTGDHPIKFVTVEESHIQ